MSIQLMSFDSIVRMIGVVGRQRMRTATMIQQVAVQCIAHSIVNRDSRAAERLYDSLNKGDRKDALVAYFEKYGNLCWNKADKKVSFFEVKKDGKLLEWTTEYSNLVASKHWTEAKPEPKINSIFDLGEKLSQLIESARKAAAKGQTVDTNLLALVERETLRYQFETFDKKIHIDTKTIDEAAKNDDEVEAHATNTAMPDNVAGIITPDTAALNQMLKDVTGGTVMAEALKAAAQ